MVSCAASGCKNTSVKGVKMNYFPKDINRRKIWIKNAKLENKTLSSSTALCEFHFTSNMWEKVRVDGTKKLKNTAIPTIFGELVTQQINRKTTINQNTANSTKEFIIITSSTTKSKHITIEPLKNPEKEEDQSKRHPSHTDEIAELSSDGNFIQNNLKEQSKHLTSNTDEIAELNSDGNFLQNVSISECDLNKQILPYVEKIKKLEKLLQKSESLRMTMKKRHKRLQSKYKNKIKELEKKVCINETFPKVIQQFLNEDQIQLLNQKYKKIPKWCNATLVKAYQLKFACGFSGYKELLNQNFPLPSIRTLNRKLENLKFTSGILDEVYQFLNIKISQFSDDRDKDCVLILDEISITPGVIFDTSSFTYIGNVTLPDHDQNEIATHSLVFMLAGVGQRWKQVIAYYYTGNRTHGSVYKQIIINIIKKAEEIGLQVHGVISDMGASNQAMWRAFNIYASRYSTIQNKCIHPCDQNRYLFFFHDCTHAFKNFKEGMLNHEFITISDSFVQKNNLPTNIAQVKHFHDLLSEQKNFPLSLCPKLRKEYLDRSKHFQKMRVKSASHILSHEVSTGLEYLASEKSKPEYKTTSWLVKNVALWFKIVSSRKAIWGISQTKSEKFDEIMNFLNEFISLISSLTFGKKNDWKPFQKGMILSTKSLIELSTYLLNNRNYKYILAGRFTQDCVENLFSVLRMKHCTLNALQFKNDLKLISISHYMRKISTSSYNEDDREFLQDFLSVIPKQKKLLQINKVDCQLNTTNKEVTLSRVELNILHHVAGYIVSSIINTQKYCHKCIKYVGCRKISQLSYNKLTVLRAYKNHTLFYVNDKTFHFFLEMEKIFRAHNDILSITNINLKQFFEDKFYNISYIIPTCHNLKKKITRRYALFRLKIYSKNSNIPKSFMSSKTMAMHNYIK